MHAVRHPDRHSVLLVTALAAAPAIIVPLVLATSLSSVSSGVAQTDSPASVALQPAAAHATNTSKLSTGNALTDPLGARTHLPWALLALSQRPLADPPENV